MSWLAYSTIAVRAGQMYCLELKALGSRLTETQHAVHDALSAAAEVATAMGFDEALQQLEAWHILRGTMS